LQNIDEEDVEEEEKEENQENEPINNYGKLTNTLILPEPKIIKGENSADSDEEDEELKDPFRGNAALRQPKIVQKKNATNLNKKLFQDEEEENLSENQYDNSKIPPKLNLTNQRELQSGFIKEENQVVSRMNSSHKEIKVMHPPPLDEEKKNLIIAAGDGHGKELFNKNKKKYNFFFF
jgi:hypothetical protein